MRPSRILCVAALLTALGATTAPAAPFRCSASAARLAVLGQAAEPLTANKAGAGCATDRATATGAAAGLTGPLSAGALVAETEVVPAQKSVVARGGVADFRVGSLPTLPIALPQVAVPDAARALLLDALTASVDLSGVKRLIPVLPEDLVTNLVTNLVTTLPTDLVAALPTDLVDNTATDLLTAVGTALTPLPTTLRTDLPTTLRTDLPTTLPTDVAVNATDPALDTAGEVATQNNLNAAANAANAAANAANAAANAANTAANTANTTANAANVLVNSLGATIDLAEAADALVWIPAANTANAAANAANTAANTANGTANTAAVAANTANAALNAANTALNLSHALTNAANLATNAANAARNALLAAIPASVGVDASGLLDAALAKLLPSGKLPTRELLRVESALATAAGACREGRPIVAGSSSVSGITVLGQASPVDQVVERVLTLIDTASIDPANLDISTGDLGLSAAEEALIATVPGAQALLEDTIRTVLRTALDALDPVKVLDPTVAQVKVVPGARVQTATSVVQQALSVTVSIAGQKLLDAVIGEAKVSTAGVDCAEPVLDPAADGTISVPGIVAPIDPDTPAGAALECSTRRLVLVDVLQRGARVKLTGVADPALAGKKVAIVFEASGDVVARARIARNGEFDTTAPLPPKRLRSTNDARYMATLGREESINLKLRRRMVLHSMTADNGRVTITGRVLPPLGRPLRAVTLKRRVSCTREEVVTRFKPDADGRFRVTVAAPRGLGSAVYRMTTKVRFSAAGSGLFNTYTLPRAVDLTR